MLLRSCRLNVPMRIVLLASLFTACSNEQMAEHPPAMANGRTIRCAVVGGLADTGLWQELGEQFTATSGHRVEIAARGPKHIVVPAFRRGHAHLLAVHACDAVINAVADGQAVDPQPWARNDFVIVGPPDDPAEIQNLEDASEALRRIVASRSKLLVHASHGAMEVLHDLLESAQLQLDAEHTLVRLEDRHRQMLMVAGQEGAYTIVGRIPFLSGKLPKQDLAIMVQGDPRLRRPYVVVVANDQSLDPQDLAAARQFASYLRSPAAQEFIAEYGHGRYDDRPLFFPVVVE